MAGMLKSYKELSFWQISGQPQSAQLKRAGYTNAPSLQDDGTQYITDNTLPSQQCYSEQKWTGFKNTKCHIHTSWAP